MRPLRSSIVRPLAEEWRETLDAIAAARGWPTSRDPARLGARVAKLSSAYNEGRALPRGPEALSARLGFSFARDVPKCAGAVRELVSTGLLRIPRDRPLRVLDLGAGLGASTWGLALSLSVAGRIESLCVDDDADALALASEIAAARKNSGSVDVRLATRRAPLLRGLRDAGGGYDVVLLGQVLSELDSGGRGDERLARHVDLVRAALDVMTESASLVLVEPALRERTRHLHALRDAVVRSELANVFAPCLHAAPCPALAEPEAWCHEDLDVDLPSWLTPTAARAGLRWQGLTFSYLVLRKDGRSVRDIAAMGRAPGSAVIRMVSDAFVTKGKREAYACGEFAQADRLVALRLRVRRLDREEGASNAAWDAARRGSLLVCTPSIAAELPRITPSTTVEDATPDAHDS